MQLSIVKQPSSETSNAGILGDQPVLVLLDAADNLVANPDVPEGAGLLVLADTVPSDNSTAETAVFADGAFTFRYGVRLLLAIPQRGPMSLVKGQARPMSDTPPQCHSGLQVRGLTGCGAPPRDVLERPYAVGGAPPPPWTPLPLPP